MKNVIQLFIILFVGPILFYVCKGNGVITNNFYYNIDDYIIYGDVKVYNPSYIVTTNWLLPYKSEAIVYTQFGEVYSNLVIKVVYENKTNQLVLKSTNTMTVWRTVTKETKTIETFSEPSIVSKDRTNIYTVIYPIKFFAK